MTKPTLAEAIKRLQELNDCGLFEPYSWADGPMTDCWAVVKAAAEKQLPLTKIVNRIISPISFDADDYGYEGIPQSPKENP